MLPRDLSRPVSSQTDRKDDDSWPCLQSDSASSQVPVESDGIWLEHFNTQAWGETS